MFSTEYKTEELQSQSGLLMLTGYETSHVLLDCIHMGPFSRKNCVQATIEKKEFVHMACISSQLCLQLVQVADSL